MFVINFLDGFADMRRYGWRPGGSWFDPNPWLHLLTAGVVALVVLVWSAAAEAGANDATGNPAISGTAVAGEMVTAGQGNVADPDGVDTTTFMWRWRRCTTFLSNSCSDITGATMDTYTLTDADVGDYIRVQLDFMDNAGNAESLISDRIGRVLSGDATGSPAISGAAVEGQTVTAGQGSVADRNGVDTSTFAWQWLRCNAAGRSCTNISMATASTYTLTTSDVGVRLKVQLNFNDDNGNAESRTSAAWPATSEDPISVECTATSAAVSGFSGTLDDLATDCNTLLGLKGELRGTGSLNWAENLAMDDWDDITVAGIPPRVTKLNVRKRGLNGTIPAALGDLTGLEQLWLDSNALSGSIPAALGDLTNLTALWLDSNEMLSGEVPSSFSRLTSLVALYLHNTQVTVPATLASWAAGRTVTTGTRIYTRTIPLAPVHSGTLAEANVQPFGVWATTTTLYVSDFEADKVFVYTLADGSHTTITLDAANADPRGLWSDGTTLWVADAFAHKLFAYTLADGMRDATKDIDVAATPYPYALWSDEETVWVVDAFRKVSAYTLATGMRDAAKDFPSGLIAANADPRGLWSDGITLWVSDDKDSRLYAYTLAGSPDDTKYLVLDPANTEPRGITAVDGTLYVVGGSGINATVYVYEEMITPPPSLRLALTATRPFWYEGDGQAEIRLAIEGESSAHNGFSVSLSETESSAGRTRDYIRTDVPETILIPAGERSVSFNVGIVDNTQLEATEFFTISTDQTGLPDSFQFVCPPGSTQDVCSETETKVYIRDDDVASISLRTDNTAGSAHLTQNNYFAPDDSIGFFIRVDGTGSCVIPFPHHYYVRVEGDTHVLTKTVAADGNTYVDADEDAARDEPRFAPCAAVTPSTTPHSLAVKPAAELSPGIYTVRFVLEPPPSADYRIYPARPYWPVKVCVPGGTVDCTNFVPPTQPALTQPPQLTYDDGLGSPPRPPGPPGPTTGPTGGTGGGGGGGGGGSSQTTLIVGYLENPGADSFQSGIGVISGWVCEAEAVEIAIGDLGRQVAGYGTERLDTQGACGDTDNGFGLLVNWNRLGDGEHEVVAFVDGVELGRAMVTVTTLGEEFVRGVAGECVAADFPMVGETVPLAWQQNSQNFVITDGEGPRGANRAGRAGVGYLENPGSTTFQSGIGVISGWVCAGEGVEVEVGHLGRQLAAYGTERLDTEDVCGDTDNGFGLLVNWNRLGAGEHAVVAYVDDVELGRATVWVTTLGEEFVRGVAGACTVEDFPMVGETVTVEWQQNQQNFVITDVQ